MGSVSVTILVVMGCAATLLAAVQIYRLGVSVGARRAHRLWTEWTGISAAELQGRVFDRELRDLRRGIGRPADPWPEETREG